GQGRGARGARGPLARGSFRAGARPDHRPARVRTVNRHAAASLWAGLGFELPAAGAEALQTLPRTVTLPRGKFDATVSFPQQGIAEVPGATEIPLQRKAVRSL